jgi:NADH-quinone oxidoreductase subunit A
MAGLATSSPDEKGTESVDLLFNLGNVFVFAIFSAVFVILNVAILSRLLRPKRAEAAKETTYECGEPPVGSSWVRFDMRFYTVALVFLIFDVEVATIYPWALVFKSLSAAGPFVYLEMLFFVLVLGVGLVYVWVKGDLDWVKSTAFQAPPPAAAERERALHETGSRESR